MGVLGGKSRRRSLGLIAVCAIVLLAACGGGSSKKGANSSDTTIDLGATNVTTSAPSGGGSNGQCFQDPGPQKARVRFVNLYTNAAHPSGAIDVWQGFSGKDACGKKLATVAFGEASDYIDVNASDSSGNWETIAFPAGTNADENTIITQSATWKGGEQVTYVFMGQDPASGNGTTAGSDQAFYEKNNAGITNSSLAVVPGKASVGVGAAAVQYIAKGAAWKAAVKGQSGCHAAVGDTETTSTNIGGTSLVPYAMSPGSVTLSLYPSDPGTCAGTPDAGPTTFDAAAGSRTLVLAYGTDAKSLKFLVLPVAD